MVEQLILEHLRAIAERAGLELGDDELHRLVPGINRARQQIADLRELVDRSDEPAGAFNAAITDRI